MSEIIYITGVSKGLGRAMALLFLEKGHRVVGIGRSHAISHVNFEFMPCDLADLDQVNAISFDEHLPAILINNAGLIGPLNRFLDASISSSLDVLTVNTLAVMQLTHTFLANTEQKRTVVTISSGAATRSIPGWAAYCASKAAVDRFMETVQLECEENGLPHRLFSVSPGVIDTPMQETIRSANPTEFSSLPTFIGLSQNNELQSPEEIAQKVVSLLENESNYPCLCHLRDVVN
jgi:benzil reductase ((S)-benzoin forming)